MTKEYQALYFIKNKERIYKQRQTNIVNRKLADRKYRETNRESIREKAQIARNKKKNS